MKKYLLFVLSFLIFVSCSSSKKMLQNQQYDAAIQKSVKKLVKDPAKTDEIKVLDEAYRVSNQLDNDKIKYLKQSGEPDVWEDIYRIYRRMKNRQSQVQRLNASVLDQINYIRVDYDAEIINAKQKAADYYYFRGKDFLDKGDRYSARSAYNEFQNVKKLYPSYNNIDALINEALNKGITKVLFRMSNHSGIMLPKNFEAEMLKISLNDVNSLWVKYDTKLQQNVDYHYFIQLDLKQIVVSPEAVKHNDYEESVEVEDGFEYALDERGNVRKDTSGNDIKIKKYKQLRCFVTETSLNKSAKVAGTLDYIDIATGQLIKTEPIAAETFFDYKFAVSKGDLEALSDKSKKLIRNKPVPFPSDIDMIFDTNEHLKKITKDIIYRNRGLLK